MRRFFTVLTLASVSAFSWLSVQATSLETSSEDELLGAATHVFRRATDTRAPAIPVSVLMRARGIAVIPVAVKGMTSRYNGVGVVSVRGANPGLWTPPAVIAFDGAVPANLETEAIGFILVAQTPRGLDYLTRDRFVSSVVQRFEPGVLEQTTPMRIDADLLAYMQFGDYFAGITVEDWTIAEMRTANARLYGRPYSTDEVVRGAGFFHLPPAARLWRDALAAYFRELS